MGAEGNHVRSAFCLVKISLVGDAGEFLKGKRGGGVWLRVGPSPFQKCRHRQQSNNRYNSQKSDSARLAIALPAERPVRNSDDLHNCFCCQPTWFLGTLILP